MLKNKVATKQQPERLCPSPFLSLSAERILKTSQLPRGFHLNQRSEENGDFAYSNINSPKHKSIGVSQNNNQEKKNKTWPFQTFFFCALLDPPPPNFHRLQQRWTQGAIDLHDKAFEWHPAAELLKADQSCPNHPKPPSFLNNHTFC